MKSIFKYSAINLKGEKIKGWCDDNNIEELILSLRKRGYFPCDIKKRNKSFEELLYRKPNYRDFSILCSNLGSMARGGIPIPQIFTLVDGLSNNRLLGVSLKEISRYVSKGQSIYESMKVFSRIFPSFLLEMIRIGEESGRLDSVLIKLSEYYEKQHGVVKKIKEALTYPLIVLITSIIVSIFLVVGVVPQFIDILNSMGEEIPLITKGVLYFCSLFKTNFIGLIFFNLLIITLLVSYTRTSEGRYYLDKIKLTIPILNKIYNKSVLARFSTAMGILLSSGFAIIKALEITSSVVENRIIKLRIQEAVEQINKGDSIYNSFVKAKISDNLLLPLVRAGEETGNLEHIFLRTGELLSKDVEESMKKIITFIEPATILILTLLIGTFIFAALLPVFNIMDGMI